MSSLTEAYRGHEICVTPIRDHEDLWDFEYRIARAGEPMQQAEVTRQRTLGGHATPEIALRAGLEVARIEVDNLLAMGRT